MRKSISVLLTGILMISLTACQGTVSQKLSQKYQNLESYTAKAVVTVTGNKGTAVYEMRQSYRAPDTYRVELEKPEHLSGMVTVVDGQKLWMKQGDGPAVPLELSGLEEETDFLFPVTVLQDFFSLDPLPQLTEGTDGMILLTMPVKKPNRYRMQQNLLFDAKSLLPTTLITHDEDGNEVLRVEYRDFERNTVLDDSIFRQ